MRERKLVENDMVYIDNTNNTYKLSGIVYIGGKIVSATIFCKDSPTGHKTIESIELVRRVPSNQTIDETQ